MKHEGVQNYVPYNSPSLLEGGFGNEVTQVSPHIAHQNHGSQAQTSHQQGKEAPAKSFGGCMYDRQNHKI